MSKLQNLMDDISEWSNKTFGNYERNPAIAYHLKKEIKELIKAIKKFNKSRFDASTGIGEYKRNRDNVEMEFADCFMLLLDSASHFDITADELIEATYRKLAINKERKWGKPDKNGVVEHIK